jgi:hypothetical protein
MLPVPVPGSQILGEYPDGLTLRVTSDREVELTELEYLDATEAKPVESNSLHEHGKDFPIPIDYSKLVKINNLMRADGGADMRGRRKRMPLCNGTDTGCVSPIDNITGRESGLTSFRCFTREKRQIGICGKADQKSITMLTVEYNSRRHDRTSRRGVQHLRAIDVPHLEASRRRPSDGPAR